MIFQGIQGSINGQSSDIGMSGEELKSEHIAPLAEAIEQYLEANLDQSLDYVRMTIDNHRYGLKAGVGSTPITPQVIIATVRNFRVVTKQMIQEEQSGS